MRHQREFTQPILGPDGCLFDVALFGCLPGALLWIVGFAFPWLQFSELLIAPCLAAFMTSFILSGVGIVGACRSPKTPRVRRVLAVFIGVLALNVLGVLRSIGAGAWM